MSHKRDVSFEDTIRIVKAFCSAFQECYSMSSGTLSAAITLVSVTLMENDGYQIRATESITGSKDECNGYHTDQIK